MPRKGRLLEVLVHHIEETLAPLGVEAQSPEIFYDYGGNKIGEIDITLRGRIGSAYISMGIECRDRKSDGKQSRDWIREIKGKQDDLNIDKMIAVSSTGFTQPAIELAKEFHIDLRIVRDLSSLDVADWFRSITISLRQVDYSLHHINIITEPKMKTYIDGSKHIKRFLTHKESFSLQDIIDIEISPSRKFLGKGKHILNEVIVPDHMLTIIDNKAVRIREIRINMEINITEIRHSIILHLYEDLLAEDQVSLVGSTPVIFANEELIYVVGGYIEDGVVNRLTGKFIDKDGNDWNYDGKLSLRLYGIKDINEKY